MISMPSHDIGLLPALSANDICSNEPAQASTAHVVWRSVALPYVKKMSTGRRLQTARISWQSEQPTGSVTVCHSFWLTETYSQWRETRHTSSSCLSARGLRAAASMSSWLKSCSAGDGDGCSVRGSSSVTAVSGGGDGGISGAVPDTGVGSSSNPASSSSRLLSRSRG